MTLKQIAEKIAANAQAVHERRITWEEFSAEQKRLWRLVDYQIIVEPRPRKGDELCIIGSRAQKRVRRVLAYLNQQ